jgi:hypothetical protein
VKVILFTVISVLIFSSCGVSDNPFFSSSSGGDGKQPVQPITSFSLVVTSPTVDQVVNHQLDVSGVCTFTDEVKVSSSNLQESMSFACINNNFSGNVEFVANANGKQVLNFLAYNFDQNEQKSIDVPVKLGTPGVAPGAITTLAISSRRTYSIELTWQDPINTGANISSYRVSYKKSGLSTWTSFSIPSNTTNTTRVTSLLAGTFYDFKIRSYNGSFSADSNTISKSTLSDHPFFTEYENKFTNVGGATRSEIVSLDNGAEIYRNNVLITTLDKGQTFEFTSQIGDVLSSLKKYYVAGKLQRKNKNAKKGNIVWNNQDLVSESFLISLIRFKKHKLILRSFKPSTIDIYRAGKFLQTVTMGVDQTKSVLLEKNGSYLIKSQQGEFFTGYAYSTKKGKHVVDPRPLIPSYKELIGIPSWRGFLSSEFDHNDYKIFTSSGKIKNRTANSKRNKFILFSGIPIQYYGNSQRIKADKPVSAISNADLNGYSSTPFLPIPMMKKNYAVNNDSKFISFASIKPGYIEFKLGGLTIKTIKLKRKSNKAYTPFRARVKNMKKGTTISSTVKVASWYESVGSSSSSDNDETILFGFN